MSDLDRILHINAAAETWHYTHRDTDPNQEVLW